MKRFGFYLLCLVVILLGTLAPSERVQAQSELPTPTPTPAYELRVPLNDGAELIIDRRISYGEIGVMLVVGLLLVGEMIYWVIRLVRLWVY